MIYKLRLLALLCILFLSTTYLHAQNELAWLTKGPVTVQSLTEIPLTLTNEPLLRTVLGFSKQSVHSTVYNWVVHKITHPEIKSFSEAEKTLLRTSFENPLAISGKIHFLFDRNLLLATQVKKVHGYAQFDERLFKAHQSRLSSTQTEIEQSQALVLAEKLARGTSYFEQFQIEELIRSRQPLAFVLEDKEIEQFATMTLQEQRNFVATKLAETKQLLVRFLNTPAEDLSAGQFAYYYKTKVRWEYFLLLSKALRLNFDQPQKSIIIRLPIHLNIDFLPPNPQGLTDAQAMGKLYFYRDYYTYDQPSGFRAHVLEQKIKELRSFHETYATAEVLNRPYEQLIKTNSLFHHEFVFKPQILAWMKTTPKPEQLAFWKGQLQRIDKYMKKFRNEHPNPSLADLKEYYRLFNGRMSSSMALSQAEFEIRFGKIK